MGLQAVDKRARGSCLRKERMRNFVAGEGDLTILEEAGADHVAEGVVFLVEGEDGGRRDACSLCQQDGLSSQP